MPRLVSRLLPILLLATVPLLATMSTASAFGHEPYPWCALYSLGNDGNSTNCGFDTIEQCRATVFGVGGTCIPNQLYPGPAEPRPHKRRHRRS